MTVGKASDRLRHREAAEIADDIYNLNRSDGQHEILGLVDSEKTDRESLGEIPETDQYGNGYEISVSERVLYHIRERRRGRLDLSRGDQHKAGEVANAYYESRRRDENESAADVSYRFKPIYYNASDTCKNHARDE